MTRMVRIRPLAKAMTRTVAELPAATITAAAAITATVAAAITSATAVPAKKVQTMELAQRSPREMYPAWQAQELFIYANIYLPI